MEERQGEWAGKAGCLGDCSNGAEAKGGGSNERKKWVCGELDDITEKEQHRHCEHKKL